MRIFITIAMLCLAAMACAQQVTNSIDINTQQEFTLRGEVHHLWDVDVTPGVSYEVILTQSNTQHPADRVFFEVWDSYWGNELLSNISYSSMDTVVATFDGPSSEHGQVSISSKIGEGTYDYGTFTLEIREHREIDQDND